MRVHRINQDVRLAAHIAAPLLPPPPVIVVERAGLLLVRIAGEAGLVIAAHRPGQVFLQVFVGQQLVPGSFPAARSWACPGWRLPDSMDPRGIPSKCISGRPHVYRRPGWGLPDRAWRLWGTILQPGDRAVSASHSPGTIFFPESPHTVYRLTSAGVSS